MKYGTKKDIVLWYSVSLVAMTWAAISFIDGSANLIHVAAIAFGFSCIFQPARNEKKREKKRIEAEKRELHELQLEKARREAGI